MMTVQTLNAMNLKRFWCSIRILHYTTPLMYFGLFVIRIKPQNNLLIGLKSKSSSTSLGRSSPIINQDQN